MGERIKGGVKDYVVQKPATDSRFGERHLLFERDAFSMDGYGEFPYELSGRAKATYNMTKHFSKVLKKAGIPHHFKSFYDNFNRVLVSDAKNLDYEDITEYTEFYMIPLVSKWADMIMPGSKTHDKLLSGAESLQAFGLAANYKPLRNDAIRTPQTRMIFYPKTDTIDAYKGEMMFTAAGLRDEDAEKFRDLTISVAKAIREDAAQKGLRVAEGLMEAIIGKRGNIYVGDTCYTWHDNRILAPAGDAWIDVSQRFVRDIYDIMGYWKNLEEVQIQAKPVDEWPAPPVPEPDLVMLMSEMCRSVSYAATGKKIAGERPIAEVAMDARKWLEKYLKKYNSDLPVIMTIRE